MWPMAWTAHVESKSMAFGSDDVWYHSKGIVSYRLDKNWKRQDWYYQRGIQRSIGQAPCDPENVDAQHSNGPIVACRRNNDDYSTMIHRGSKMFFISWKNGTEVGSSDPAQIAECNWLDLQVVGNIRPDWFMDDRGDSTDVQYLGDQHVFYQNEPRLVKQWRKKDFANQYFVMSMLGNPKDDDGIHWPMILNVPGEGFGDDFLQTYTNHSLLTDEEDYLFLLEEALESIGGSCPQMDMYGGGGEGEGVGPPVTEVHIPSNLEVDPNSWFSNVYTFSPVWEPEDTSDLKDEIASSNQTPAMAVTNAEKVTVLSCYDEQVGAVRLSFEFNDIEMVDGGLLPWTALGFRESNECLMIPRSGADTQIILIQQSSPEEDAQAFLGSLPAAARGMSEEALSSVYQSLESLQDTESFSNVVLETPSTTTTAEARMSNGQSKSVRLEFLQFRNSTEGALHLMYAIGSSSTLGFHTTRHCFDVTEFPICAHSESQSEIDVSGGQIKEDDTSSSGCFFPWSKVLALFSLVVVLSYS